MTAAANRLILRSGAAVAAIGLHLLVFWLCNRSAAHLPSAMDRTQSVEVALVAPPDQPRTAPVANSPAAPILSQVRASSSPVEAAASTPAPGFGTDVTAPPAPSIAPAATPDPMRKALIPPDPFALGDGRVVSCPDPPPPGAEGERCRRTAELAARTGVARTREREAELDREAHRKEVLTRYRDHLHAPYPGLNCVFRANCD